MEHLWDWKCPLTAGKNVAAMGWNKVNPDLLAVGYGSSSFAAACDERGAAAVSRGLVAFWSLKNPQFPLWWFETQAAVTALDFSTYSPNMLAVGLYDGTVAIHDIKARQSSPAMESDVHSGKHADPVWKVRGRGRAGVCTGWGRSRVGAGAEGVGWCEGRVAWRWGERQGGAPRQAVVTEEAWVAGELERGS